MTAPAYIWSNQLALFGESYVVGFGADDFFVREIHRDQANAIIRRNHYSKKVFATSVVHLGVFIGGEMLGVLQFGCAMNPASQEGVVAGTAQDEYLELNRMWLDDFAPRNSESRAISYAVKYLRRARPKIRWIQSFADERCGLHGTVYQAANFVYCGEHASIFWELDGEFYHNIIATAKDVSKTGPAGPHLQKNLNRATRHELRQFRYVFFMAPRFAKGLKLAVKDYPKPDYATRPADEQGAPLCEPEASSGGRSTITGEAA